MNTCQSLTIDAQALHHGIAPALNSSQPQMVKTNLRKNISFVSIRDILERNFLSILKKQSIFETPQLS